MKRDTAIQVLQYLESNQSNMITFLENLVKLETPSRDALAQQAILQLLKKEFEKIKYKVFLMPGKKTGGFLYARPLEKKWKNPVQLVLGHCDTVWKKNTLEEMPVKHLNSKISGPGVFDMKAGLTQIVFALKAVKELNLSTKVTPVVLINSDEEIGSLESTNTIKKIAKIANRAFVLEPPYGMEGKLKTARKGVGRFTIKVRGKTAHAGLNPSEGASAIMELSHHIQYLFSLNDVKSGITVNVGMIEGGTSANVVAAESKAVIDVRVKNEEDAKLITAKILGIKPVNKNIIVEIEGAIKRPPMKKTQRNETLWKIAKNIGELLQINLEDASVGGGSDGNTTSMFTATLDGLGTVGDGAHAKHEFIYSNKLVERTALVTLLLLADSV